MGRGISEQQKQILGVAYHANRLTQGAPKVKTGAPVTNYREPTVGYEGGKDMLWPLAAHVLRGLEFTVYGQKSERAKTRIYQPAGGYFDLSSNDAKAVKVATVRAITSLAKRGLLRLAPIDKPIRWGYVLTREGFDIGAEHEAEFDPLVYVRAGMVWYPGNTTNEWFWRPFHYVQDHPAPLPDILRDAAEIREKMKYQGYTRATNGYQVSSTANLITHNHMEARK